MANSPDTLNYVLSQGNVYFTPSGGSKFHMGNSTRLLYSPTVDKLEHFSRMTPVRTKDKTFIRQISATVQLTLEEITFENIGIFMQGDSANTSTIAGLSNLAQEGLLEFTGTNSVGNQLAWSGQVSFTPSGDFDFLKEDLTEILLTADVLVDSNGFYGETTITEAATAT